MKTDITKWMASNWVLIDLETTGLEPDRHGLVEVAAMKADGQVFCEECRPRVGAEVDADALEVNGHSMADLEKCPTPEWLAVSRLDEWMGEGFLLCGLNVGSFDAPMLRSAVDYSVCWGVLRLRNRRLAHRYVDLHSWAVLYARLAGVPVPERGFSADALADLVGIEREGRPHNAADGVLWAAEAFQRLFELLGADVTPGVLEKRRERLVQVRELESLGAAVMGGPDGRDGRGGHG